MHAYAGNDPVNSSDPSGDIDYNKIPYTWLGFLYIPAVSRNAEMV